jgi:hypothetical protein
MRPLGILLLRVEGQTGAFEALCTSFAQLRILRAEASSTPEVLPGEVAAPDGILGPVVGVAGVLDAGSSIVGICADPARLGSPAFADATTGYLARAHEQGTPVPVQDAATWARGRTVGESDIAIVAVSRHADEST